MLTVKAHVDPTMTLVANQTSLAFRNFFVWKVMFSHFSFHTSLPAILVLTEMRAEHVEKTVQAFRDHLE